jgi:ABC-2 type transport system ATP-binding protein
MPTTNGLVACGLTKRFGDVLAVSDVSLEIAPGEVLLLLGRNGAGKSTLLRMLGTTVLPDAGSATIAGHDVVRSSREARRVTGFFLGEERSWYWRLSGRRNLEFFAALHGLSRSAAAARASELLEMMGLGDVGDRPFGHYSAGMKVRLSLARALVTQPQVILLDEPTRSLDPAARFDFRDLVTTLMREAEAAVLFATHDLHEAEALGGRAVCLRDGQIVATAPEGTPAEDLERIVVAA